MKQSLLRPLALISLLIASSVLSFAQVSSTAPLTGTVSDPNGAVIAGATISVKNPSTGQEFAATTGDNGSFTIPAVSAGTYTVRVTASGFKTAVVKDVAVLAGTAANVNIAMTIGTTSEEIQISGGGEVLNATNANISSTIVGRQITDLPFASRNALDLVLFLPGTSSPARPRQSTINGLPKGGMNITVDGINIQDNLIKSSDGFFTFIQPKTDAIDEVTVSTATPGAESSGEGAVQIKFVTRAGGNSFNGSAYEYLRNPSLNANYYFNNLTGQPRTRVILNQPGVRVGGPIIKDRVFFFVNYEEYRLPEATFRQRQLLNAAAQTGVYTYTDGSNVTHSINVLGLAAAGTACNGGACPSAIDPTVGGLLNTIRQSTTKGGSVAALDANMDQLSFINTGGQTRRFPTVRFDINLTSKHHLENIYNYQEFRNKVDFLNNNDPAFPGFTNAGGQDSDRFSDSMALRSTITNTLVNEARFGFVGGSSRFQSGAAASQFDIQGGFSLGINAFGNGLQTLSTATGARTPSKRNSPIWQFNDNLSWTRGDHNMAFGMSFTQANGFIDAFGGVAGFVPTINFGLLTGDSAANLFSTTNFPGASSTQRAQAQALYAVLTGHVSAINGSASIDEATGKYTSQGHLIERFHQREFGFYGQDTWRFRPNLTLTGGLRWEIELPFTPLNNVYTQTTEAGLFGVSGDGNLFKPGTLTGQPTTFTPFNAGDKPYNTDLGDFAPSIGFAWSPNFKEGLLHKLGGENGQTVIRGGYSVAYNREGTNFFSAAFDANGGVIFNTTRNAALGNINPGTLLSGGVSLVTPPAAPTFPYVGQVADQAIAFTPNLKTGRVHSWTFGIQRELNKDTVLEARYVGNRAMDLWRLFSLNETNVVENGFLSEFQLAQQNLIANNAAVDVNRHGSFAYFGAGSGTSPLPIIVGYLNSVSAANAGNKDLYTSANFKSTTFTNTLGTALPNVNTFATTLWGNAGLRANALAAGLPANLFVVNPGVGSPTAGGPFLINNDSRSYYDAFVLELRRRLSHGLLFQGSYTFSKSLTNSFASSSFGQKNYFSLHDTGLDRGVSPFDVNHAFKANFIYELPVGKGQRFLDGTNSIVDHLVSGWSMAGTVRIQSGTPFGLGNVQLVGMSRQEFQDNIAIRHGANAAGNAVVFYLPPDIIANTIAAFNGTFAPTGRYLAPANMNAPAAFGGSVGYANLVGYGPRFTRFDISFVKRTKITERINFEFRTEFLNAFNNINFRITSPNNDVGTVTGFGSSTFGQTTFAYQDVSTTNDPGGRLIQFVARINF